MPLQPRPVADERDGLAVFIAQQQDAFRAALFGLTDAQAGAAPTPSTLSVGTLTKHVTHTQQTWLECVQNAPEPVPPADETYATWQAAWTWTDADTVEQALARFDEVSAAVLRTVAEADLDTPVPVPPAPWNPKDVSSWSVRWVWLHMVEELARHAGHADIVREAVDGATMYALVAGREGLPETPWLKPWHPDGA